MVPWYRLSWGAEQRACEWALMRLTQPSPEDTAGRSDTQTGLLPAPALPFFFSFSKVFLMKHPCSELPRANKQP